jgi:hypothetical protein
MWAFKGYMHEALYGVWATSDLEAWAGNGR